MVTLFEIKFEVDPESIRRFIVMSDTGYEIVGMITQLSKCSKLPSCTILAKVQISFDTKLSLNIFKSFTNARLNISVGSSCIVSGLHV